MFTEQSRSVKIGTNIINPHSKFRRKINQFDLAGDFLKGKKRLYSLIDTFNEEYILNHDRVPKLQWEYLKDDVRYIESKLVSLEVLMRNQDDDRVTVDKLKTHWDDTLNKLKTEQYDNCGKDRN